MIHKAEHFTVCALSPALLRMSLLSLLPQAVVEEQHTATGVTGNVCCLVVQCGNLSVRSFLAVGWASPPPPALVTVLGCTTR